MLSARLKTDYYFFPTPARDLLTITLSLPGEQKSGLCGSYGTLGFSFMDSERFGNRETLPSCPELLPKKRSAHSCLFVLKVCAPPPLKQGWGWWWPQMAKQKREESARQQPKPFLLGMDTSPGIFSANPPNFTAPATAGLNLLGSQKRGAAGVSWGTCRAVLGGGEGCFVQKMGRGSEVSRWERWGSRIPPLKGVV